MPTLETLFSQFLRERTYLKNISPRTRVWYETAWHGFLATQDRGTSPRSRSTVARRSRGSI